MALFKLPHTSMGWKRLGWILLRRCVQCHEPLSQDWPQYDDGFLWCLRCGGVPHPKGVLMALRWNAKAKEKNA